MYALKLSKKEVKSSIRYNERLVSTGYCSCQYLLDGIDRLGYSVGVYGWSCDYYQVGNIIISTGYSPIGIDCNNIINKYETKAKRYYLTHTRDSFRKYQKRLLSQMIRELNGVI